MAIAARPQPLVPPLEAVASAVAPRQRRSELFLPLAFHAAVLAALAASGYPAGRLAVLALVLLVQQGQVACGKGDFRRCVNADTGRVSRQATGSKLAILVTSTLAVAITGGLRSPLLVLVAAPYLGGVAAVGDRRATRMLLGGTAFAVGVLAVLPRAWTGPELAPAVHGLLTVASVLGIGALAVPVFARARRKREDLERAGKELATDALARARSLEQIASKVAHELKNPLTGVKALVQLGLRNPAEAASHGRLEVLEREVTRMQEILQNYLSFTRPLQEVSPRRLALGHLVSDTLVVLSGRADDAGVKLYAEGDATLEADPRRLKEALMNLVANAIEATAPGGEVAVEVRSVGDGAEIVVRDNGRGMPAETLRRIGTPFFTTREDGTGLGVVLARSVIAQHGGSMRYESEPGRGTRVRVTLPRAAGGGRDAACPARG